MYYRITLLIILSLFIFSCDQSSNNKSKINNTKFISKYKNTGFALVYNNDLQKIKPLEERSLNIYHKSIKKRSMVKITNPQNNKYLIAEVKSNRVKFSDFYNSILSMRIAKELELDLNEPYVEVTLISKDSTFIAKKAKIFDEERSVAEKAPVDGIQIKDLNKKIVKSKLTKIKSFSYSIKIADFYYKDTAQMMVNRIKSEVPIKKLKIITLSKINYRVLIGPFSDIKTLKESFEKMRLFNFENLEILKND